MRVQSFHDKHTATFTHVVSDPALRRAAVIDPVMGYDAQSGTVSSTPAQAIIAYLQTEGLTLEWILETHIHADHLTGSSYLKQKMGGKTRRWMDRNSIICLRTVKHSGSAILRRR
jgi:glyoxylase-like metal-dependent hydrolase (beta-lactamase superfamily II)